MINVAKYETSNSIYLQTETSEVNSDHSNVIFRESCQGSHLA